jgi:outer membrane receptor protein involved in Fe transport
VGSPCAIARSIPVAACSEDDIAPGPLAGALKEVTQQTGLQLGYASEIAATQASKGATRGSSAHDALVQLLEGTGLSFEFLNEKTVGILPAPTSTADSSKIAATTQKQARGRTSLWTGTLDEVLVTATRRERHVNEVPMSLAVWTQDEMARSGIKGMAEIGALTPGVEFDFNTNLAGDVYTNLVIRGVTQRHGATTGVFVDDAPLPAARAETFARSFPWAFDLERVEILRGGVWGGGVRGGCASCEIDFARTLRPRTIGMSASWRL